MIERILTAAGLERSIQGRGGACNRPETPPTSASTASAFAAGNQAYRWWRASAVSVAEPAVPGTPAERLVSRGRWASTSKPRAIDSPSQDQPARQTGRQVRSTRKPTDAHQSKIRTACSQVCTYPVCLRGWMDRSLFAAA